MLFYAGLLVASVIAAVIALWLYRGISGAGKAVYQAILPSSKGQGELNRELDQVAMRTTVNRTSTPWGWQGGAKPSQVARSATPAQTADSPLGLDLEQKGRARQPQRKVNFNRPAGALALGMQEPWTSRDEEFEFAGKTYTVKRQAISGRTDNRAPNKPKGF